MTRPGGILALDIATVVGWAAACGNDTPVYGEMRMGERGCSIGECFLAFDIWLLKQFNTLQPKVLIFESPALIQRGSADINYRLMGLAAIAELNGVRYGLRVFQAASDTVAKHFTGRGRWPAKEKKPAVMKMCRIRGWNPQSEDASDALALLDYAQSLLQGQHAAARAAGPLFR